MNRRWQNVTGVLTKKDDETPRLFDERQPQLVWTTPIEHCDASVSTKNFDFCVHVALDQLMGHRFFVSELPKTKLWSSPH